MLRLILGSFLFVGLVLAGGISPAKYAKLVQKGELAALNLCDETKLSQIKSKTVAEILKDIETVRPCISLNSRNKEALAYFLMAGSTGTLSNVKGQMQVPKEVKCPVCGMFVAKYPKWAALIAESGKHH